MKIAYLLGSLNRGGTETLLLDCFQNTTLAGFQIIGVYRKDGVLTKDFTQTSVPIYKLSPSSIFDLKYIYRLRKLFLSQQVDIVHAQQTVDGLSALLATAGTHIKVVLTVHGYDFENSLFVRLLNKIVFNKTSMTIFVSKTQQNYFKKKYHLKDNNLSVVYNGISFNKLDLSVNISNKDSIRKELGISSNEILIGTVGNFVSGRDPQTICRFLNLLSREKISYKFIFVGKKNEAESWIYDGCVNYCSENNLDNKVYFIGSRDDVPAILKQLDAFIYATDHDTFGIAVVEAIASGIPVFVNDWEVMNEISDDGKWAIIYKTKNEQDLLNKFQHYIQHSSSYIEQATKAAKETRFRYDIGVYLKKIQLLYQRII